MLKLMTQHTLFVHFLTYSVPLRECGIDCVTITIIINWALLCIEHIELYCVLTGTMLGSHSRDLQRVTMTPSHYLRNLVII